MSISLSLLVFKFSFLPTVFCEQNFDVYPYENGFGYHKVITRQVLDNYTHLIMNTTANSGCKYYSS